MVAQCNATPYGTPASAADGFDGYLFEPVGACDWFGYKYLAPTGESSSKCHPTPNNYYSVSVTQLCLFLFLLCAVVDEVTYEIYDENDCATLNTSDVDNNVGACVAGGVYGTGIIDSCAETRIDYVAVSSVKKGGGGKKAALSATSLRQ